MGQQEILIPPESLLSEFSNLCDPMIDEILLLNIQKENLRQTRDLLLPKLISGKLDVSELDIDTGIEA